jgi:hypothetical protein
MANVIDDAKALLKSAVDSNRDPDGMINMPETADYLAQLLSNINSKTKAENREISEEYVGNDFDCTLLAQHLSLRICEERINQSKKQTEA